MLLRQLHQRMREWETERTNLQQRLKWSETLLNTKRQKLDKATEDASCLRGHLAEAQQGWNKAELELSQRALQILRAGKHQ